MYKLNIDYFKENLSSNDSELLNCLLEYEGVLPIQLDYLLNIDINPLNLPKNALYKIRKKHEMKLIEHGRYESFKLPGESFSDCEERLIKELMDQTKLPIFKEVKE